MPATLGCGGTQRDLSPPWHHSGHGSFSQQPWIGLFGTEYVPTHEHRHFVAAGVCFK